MSEHTRSRDELKEELDNQLAAIRRSAEGYDSGLDWEAARLATAVHTLVSGGRPPTNPLLAQLKIRSRIKFLSTSHPNSPTNLLAWTPLCKLRVGPDDAKYLPVLDGGPFMPKSNLTFDQWWNEAVYENAAGAKLSRKNLVYSLRSKDGGSHYDATLPAGPYLTMKAQSGGWSYVATEGAGPKLIPNAHLATMRQIAFELLESIEAHRTEAIAAGTWA